MAGRLLRRERSTHTLQRTALVHEAFLRLMGQHALEDLEPQTLLAFAAHQMRHILIDYGRAHSAQKRGGELVRVPLFENELAFARDEDAFLALSEALDRLGELDSRALAVVELKFFGGCTTAEAGEVLGVPQAEVEGLWKHARAWLYRELSRDSHRKPSIRMISEVSESTRV